MPTYTVEFFTDADWADHSLEAASPAEALVLAKAIYEDQPEQLMFESYDQGGALIQITIHDANGDTVVDWKSPQALLADAASTLLEKLERALVALNAAPRFAVPALDTHSYAIALECEAAIRLAKEG